MAKHRNPDEFVPALSPDYGTLVSGISELLDQTRRAAARAVNRILTASYWDIGRRIIEFEQGGKARAPYGKSLLKGLAADLTQRHGRGCSERNLENMRNFYHGWEISQTPSAKLQARVKSRPPTTGTATEAAVPMPALPLPPFTALADNKDPTTATTTPIRPHGSDVAGTSPPPFALSMP
jgi:hypothetical protein